MALIRLDELMVERGLAPSVEKAAALVLAGIVYSNGRRMEKAGTKVKRDLPLSLVPDDCPFVSRGGVKLAHALKTFDISVIGRICIDIGSSTGGFTDCLLQNGAARVFSVDVGYGIIDSKLRRDSRVVLLERTNARNLNRNQLGVNETPPSLAVIDVSFISLTAIVPPVQLEFKISEWVCLFKPQFEVAKNHVMPGGIVTDGTALADALRVTQDCLSRADLTEATAPLRSPITGKRSGNVEYLLHYRATA